MTIPPRPGERNAVPAKMSPEAAKEEYHRRYHEFKELGKPFWPDVIFEDLIAILILVAVLALLVVTRGVPLGNVANPSSTGFIPRPEWYFMFMFRFLAYIPGAFEWLGIALVPTLFIILLLVLPFVDRGQKAPVLGWSAGSVVRMGGVVLMIVIVGLTFEAYRTTPPSAKEVAAVGGVQLTGVQQIGRNIFESNCISCHQLAGQGYKGGNPLDGIGSQMSVNDLHSFIENPRMVNPKANMPGFIGVLTHAEVEAVAQYLSMSVK